MTDHDLHVDDAELLARLRRIADTVDPSPKTSSSSAGPRSSCGTPTPSS